MRLYISQPMKGKTEEEIKADRARVIRMTKIQLEGIADPDDLQVIDNLNRNDNEGDDRTGRIYNLAQSIAAMSEAEYVVFAPGWKTAAGCKVEYRVAKEYGIPCLTIN